MKRCTSIILAVVILLTCLLSFNYETSAATKEEISRAIGIVFDNSRSMYLDGNMAWCRATYAMEVFASMLNEGDTLQIYPMHPIEVEGKEYTMEKPLRITDAEQASTIRGIVTPEAKGTPIESLDFAAQGLQGVQADKKYMIVLTDGTEFSKMSEHETKQALDSRFQDLAEKNVTAMYLGIGKDAIMPDTENSENFVKKQAKNSEDVLAALTEMCNLVFGRDTMPDSCIQGKTMKFDISMKKLIVFVQGPDVSNLNVPGAGQPLSTTSTKYGTDGCGNEEAVADTSLQGMMVTYGELAAGDYPIEYDGTATSVEVYYEPDADLAFVFTDAAGNEVDPNALYEGEYKVSYGMKDAKTGELISSVLLGNPHYEGSYFVDGEETTFTCDGHNGVEPVTLAMGDSFDANLTVTYLSGYTISKDSSDFGWPAGGIQVAARPAGDFRLEITGGEELYSLKNLEESAPYIAKLYYQGEQLTGDELKSAELKWDPETSNVEIKKEFAEDHYKLSLHYKNPENPEATVCGECTVDIYAFYTAQGSSEAQGQTTLTYNIENDFSPLQMELLAPEDYILFSQIENSQPITVKLTMEGEPLTAKDFAAVTLEVDSGALVYVPTPCEQESCYTLQLQSAEGAEKGKHPVHVKVYYNNEEADEDTVKITLSNTPLWAKRLGILLLILLLIIVLLVILHIRVLPNKTHATKRDSRMILDGEDESKGTAFQAKVEKGRLLIFNKYAGTKTGLTMEVKPGKDSYLRKKQVRRSAEVKSATVKKYGNPTITEATIGGARYMLNEDTQKLERVPKSDKPFVLRHGTPVSYSGTMLIAGIQTPFTVNTKLNFKKK